MTSATRTLSELIMSKKLQNGVADQGESVSGPDGLLKAVKTFLSKVHYFLLLLLPQLIPPWLSLRWH